LPPSGSSDGSTRSSLAFDMLHAGIKKWAWKQGWQRLRSIQEEAILAILGTSNADLVISAPTAGGKTEAVYMPMLSRIASSDSEIGFKVLYVAPLRALIDDQYERVSDMAGSVDVRVAKWHGDVTRSTKEGVLRHPSGIMMTTPESLEAFFVLRAGSMQRLFHSLEFVVLDELHSLMPSERGRQVQSLLCRLNRFTEGNVRRIALSATIGDMQSACNFLRPPVNETAIKIVSDDTSELRIALHAFVRNAPDEGYGRARAEEMSGLLFRKLRGSNSLVFSNTRQQVETLSDTLRRMSEEQGVPNEFHPHHGSLSRDLRHYAEQQLKKKCRPATVVCTSTLELGIDVGHIESIAQVGTAPSVSSIAQRLGRSGRRGNAAVLSYFVVSDMVGADCHVEDHLHLELVQVIAQTELLLERWCESASTGEKHLSTLLHQILSVICERGGALAKDIWSLLCSNGPFRNISRHEFALLLRQMGVRELIEQAPGGLLLLGREGERLQRQKDFYAVFHTPEEYTLLSPEGPLGALPIRFPLIPGEHMIFGGTRWLIFCVDELKRVAVLHPSPAGRVPKFAGSGWLAGDEVRRRMKSVLLGEASPAYLDPTARELLNDARTAFREFGLHHSDFIRWNGKMNLFCWRGDRIRLTLKALLGRAGLDTTALGVALSADCSRGELMKSLLQVASSPAPIGELLAAQVPNKEGAKYDAYLGDDLLSVDYASRVFEVQKTVSYASRILDSYDASEPADGFPIDS